MLNIGSGGRKVTMMENKRIILNYFIAFLFIRTFVVGMGLMAGDTDDDLLIFNFLAFAYIVMAVSLLLYKNEK